MCITETPGVHHRPRVSASFNHPHRIIREGGVHHSPRVGESLRPLGCIIQTGVLHHCSRGIASFNPTVCSMGPPYLNVATPISYVAGPLFEWRRTGD